MRTVQQIHKDLSGLVKVKDDFLLDFSQDIYLQIEEHLIGIITEMSNSVLQQFVYNVDLKEYDYLNAISTQDNFQKLSFLIIQREAQKVYFKSQYS